jgi:hypothetical protein
LDNTCQCKPGYTRQMDGQCYNTQCPLSYTFSATEFKCVKICSDEFIWDSVSGKCIPKCKPNENWNGN